mgnify:CR=1 FL=1
MRGEKSIGLSRLGEEHPEDVPDFQQAFLQVVGRVGAALKAHLNVVAVWVFPVGHTGEILKPGRVELADLAAGGVDLGRDELLHLLDGVFTSRFLQDDRSFVFRHLSSFFSVVILND